MRISDWSSDVCSSDLIHTAIGVTHEHGRALVDEQAGQFRGFLEGAAAVVAQVDDDTVDFLLLQLGQQFLHIARGDRKRVVSGKSVSVRVDIGGSRIIKKKNKDI